MIIAVGSDNPVKIAAAKDVAGRVYPGANFINGRVASGVSDNPSDDAEAISGAKERARRVRKEFSADLGIGLEGGIVTVDGRLMTAGWAAVCDGENYHVGGGGHLALPPSAVRGIVEEGKELGEAMDDLVGEKGTKRGRGAIGILTRGLSDRRRAYREILAYAFAPLISRRLYSGDLFPAEAPPALKPLRPADADAIPHPSRPSHLFDGSAASIATIVVGSANPLKLRAVAETAGRIRPGCRVSARPAASGVSDNPLSNEETIAGALERARAARKSAGAGWGVGLEGGMTLIGGEWYTCVWCVIWDGEADTRGGGVHFQLPPPVIRAVLEEGKEIGRCMDELTGMARTKRRMGAEGILTAGLIDRTAGFVSSFIYALSPRLHP